MIDIDRLSKRFSGRTVVNDLSFRIDRGEIVGLLGPNGAGKSTTLKMLSGFLAPSAGSVRIFGFDMQDKARQAQKLIGYLPENAPSYGEMTVEWLSRLRRVHPRLQRTGKTSAHRQRHGLHGAAG